MWVTTILLKPYLTKSILTDILYMWIVIQSILTQSIQNPIQSNPTHLTPRGIQAKQTSWLVQRILKGHKDLLIVGYNEQTVEYRKLLY